MKPVVAITIGDPNGIGPEVVLRAVRARSVTALCHPVLVGPWKAFRYYAGLLNIRPSSLLIHDESLRSGYRPSPGANTLSGGRTAAEALRAGAMLTLRGGADALVTAPVSKLGLWKAGIRSPGQTEYLQSLTRAKDAAMMLLHKRMRVGLITIHEPIRNIPRLITGSLLTKKIETIVRGLASDWHIRRPRVAVLGLNPHAGENGRIGLEEKRIIVPAIRKLKKHGMRVDGPFPADSFFSAYQQSTYDAVIAMYHDQGLIPLKMTASSRAVNVTLGLPIVRTSPDHGTAFDIAGKGIANPSSMIEAIKTAVFILKNRRKHRRS